MDETCNYFTPILIYFIYNIQTEDFYEDLKKNISYFDTSDYDVNNQFCIPRLNKKNSRENER